MSEQIDNINCNNNDSVLNEINNEKVVPELGIDVKNEKKSDDVVKFNYNEWKQKLNDLVNGKEVNNKDDSESKENAEQMPTNNHIEFDTNILNAIEKFAENLAELVISSYLSELNDEEEEEIIDDTVYSRDCFDRFNGELCSKLLSYLPIYDKIKLQFVSKKWQRNIFMKQTRLIVTYDIFGEEINAIKKTHFVKIIKRCRFVKEIEINYREISEDIINTISNSCRHLEKFVSTAYFARGISEPVLDKFARKCGPTLKYIQINSINAIQLKNLLRFTPNLKSVYCNNNISVVINDSKNSSEQPFLPNLEHIEIVEFKVEELLLVSQQFSKQIKILNITFSSSNLIGIKMNTALQHLSQFENLEVLKISINLISRSVTNINEGLISISKQCTKLRHLIFRMKGKFIAGKLFLLFGNFHALEKCKIFIPYDYTANEYGYIDAFSKCKSLTHLILVLPKLNDDHLEAINEILPNLSTLNIHTEAVITNKTLRFLANLEKLYNLEIILYKNNEIAINDTGLCNLICSCKTLRSLSLDSNSTVTNLTTDSFISLAEQNPKNQYKLYFKISNIKRKFEYNKFITKPIPDNLFVEIYSTLDTIDQLQI